jgi:tetratricopeptide (TPR) repeat protein
VSAGQWPIARRAYETLLAHSPAAWVGHGARIGLAEALFRTGATAEARTRLERAVASGGEGTARALLVLAEMHDAAGERRAALAAYDRLFRDHPDVARSTGTLLRHARLLEESGQAQRAQPVLQRLVELADGEVAAEGAYRLGEILSANGQHAAAVEWYLTAAYVAEGSEWARRAWVGAGTSLSVLERPQDAEAAYRRVFPSGEPGGEAPSALPRSAR